ncbi:MAG: 4Fe-4S dicluster domain-containing protein [Candidatus Helarchaeota archaeon]
MFDRREFMKRLTEEIKKAQESMEPPPEPIFYYEACNGCGSCLFICESIKFDDVDEAREEMDRAIKYSLGNSEEKPLRILNDCVLCGICSDYCSRLAEPVVLFKKIKDQEI